ncbi:MAG: DUF2867 domain-containing protein [Spirochaetes bacterium]|nr:DUF2867 domain-containing protein [Spirochaetota bacterium]
MKKVKRTKTIPDNSIISKNFNGISYCDSYSIKVQTKESIDKITTDIFQTPSWADALMAIRNKAVKLFGLQGGGRKKNTGISDYYPVGSKAVYFTVIDRNENEIVTAENDKHLNFRVSVMTVREANNVIIHLTTLVKFNNIIGRIYFLPVKPFHRLIVASLLQRILKKDTYRTVQY